MAHWETTAENKWIRLSDSLLDDDTGHGPLRTAWKYMHWARCWERVTNRLLANNRKIVCYRKYPQSQDACHRKYPCAAMIPTGFHSREGKGDNHDACHRNGEGKGAGKWEGKGKDRRTLGDARDRSAQATGGGKAGN